MLNKMKEAAMATKADVVFMDIDGTIKNLVKEHQTALSITVNGFNRGKKLRRSLVFFIDKVAMSFVKSGTISTNRDRQEFLLATYAFILGKSISEFRVLYDTFYKDKIIVFKDAKEVIEEIAKTKEVYFVTVNSQNYNLEKLGVNRANIFLAGRKEKVRAYKEIMTMLDVDSEQVLIIGDNLFDDVRPAKKLECECLLMDNYNSKFKRFLAKLFKVGIV